LIIYRLHRDTRRAFDYNINRENRWNPAHTPMLYCAAAVSLCCLEVLVHTDPDLIPDNFVWSWAELPEEPERFEGAWDILDAERTRRFGKTWIESKQSLSLRVPSVTVPLTRADFNVLLNPIHDAYGAVAWHRGGMFGFDPRLFSKASA
jgi:RES domain-containing protein